MLDTGGYKDSLRICNTHCFSTAIMVARSASLIRYTYVACLVHVFSVTRVLQIRYKYFFLSLYISALIKYGIYGYKVITPAVDTA